MFESFVVVAPRASELQLQGRFLAESGLLVPEGQCTLRSSIGLRTLAGEWPVRTLGAFVVRQ